MKRYGIWSLNKDSKWTQNWYADDSACVAELKSILEWLNLLLKEGPKYGYIPEPDKSYLVVHPSMVDAAKKMFAHLKINVVVGQRFLGAFIGNHEETEKWLEDKLTIWIKALKNLSKAAESQPHLAYVSLTKSLQNEWAYVQRVMANIEKPFSLIRSVLVTDFLPSLFQGEISDIEASLMLMSNRRGGLGIRDPVASSSFAFQSSKNGTRRLSEAVFTGAKLDLCEHETQMVLARNEARVLQDGIEEAMFIDKISQLPLQSQKTLQRIKEGECSTWLSMIPTCDNHFLMSADVFRDSIALRYARNPVKMQGFCDGCSKPFDITHALDCKRGGLVGARHNESRDLNLDLIHLTGLTQTVKEPVLKEPGPDGLGGLRVDWGVRGFWEFQREALFDIRIINADAPSYSTLSLESLFNKHRDEKKVKYNVAAELRRATFTPIIATCDGIFDHEAKVYMKRLATLLSSKWSQSYSQIYGWIKARMQVCILRSVSLCIRGSRTHWRGAGIEHGAQISVFS